VNKKERKTMNDNKKEIDFKELQTNSIYKEINLTIIKELATSSSVYNFENMSYVASVLPLKIFKILNDCNNDKLYMRCEECGIPNVIADFVQNMKLDIEYKFGENK
jgi:hypothetical protein